MELELGNIATDEKRRLSGFRVLGIFPFYLKYISTGTHIRLCVLKEQIQAVLKTEPSVADFYDSKIQKEIIPLVNNYIITALLNARPFSFLLRVLLTRKIRKCGHYHILNLYATIQKLDEPAFFLSYWKWMVIKDHTLLKEVKQS